MTRLSVTLLATLAGTTAIADTALTYGPRPAYLVSQMTDSPLTEQLLACADQTPTRSDFSIGHRGAPLMFPEHTVESFLSILSNQMSPPPRWVRVFWNVT